MENDDTHRTSRASTDWFSEILRGKSLVLKYVTHRHEFPRNARNAPKGTRAPVGACYVWDSCSHAYQRQQSILTVDVSTAVSMPLPMIGRKKEQKQETPKEEGLLDFAAGAIVELVFSIAICEGGHWLLHKAFRSVSLSLRILSILFHFNSIMPCTLSQSMWPTGG